MFEQKPKNELELAVDAAAAELRRLQAQAANLPAELRAASNRADAAAIVELTERRNKLPAYLYAAEIKLARARIAVLEAEKAEAERSHRAVGANLAAGIEQVFDEIATAEKHLNDLYSKRQQLQLSESSSYAAVREIAIKIEREQNILQQLINKQVNDAPQVDEAWERSDTAMYQRSNYQGVTVMERPAAAHQLKEGESLRVEYDGD
jgi:hypothetical protein